MKKSLLALSSKRLILSLLLAVASVAVWAYDVCVDGIYYNLDKNHNVAEVTYKSFQDEYVGDVKIPSSITCDGVTYQVTSIGDYAFAMQTKMTSIALPDGITTIGLKSFQNCGGLESIELPKSLTCIGDNAFDYCINLSSIVIPNNVTTMGKYVFCDCHKLQSITLSNSLECIPEGTFTLCKELSTVAIPSSVRSIGSGAFQSCTSLKSITIPSTVENIVSPFDGCGGCDGISIHVESLNYWLSTNVEGAICYYRDKDLDGPMDVDEYGGWRLFVNNQEVKNLNIPEGTTEIGDQFQSCLSIETVNIPSSITQIGAAFNRCVNLTKAKLPNTITTLKGTFSGCKKLKDVNAPSALMELGAGTFSHCKSLQSFNIPNTVKILGESAFWGCTGLTDMTIPASVQEIGEYVFWGCNLNSLTVPETIESLAYNAFYRCGLIRFDWAGIGFTMARFNVLRKNDIKVSDGNYYYSSFFQDNPGDIKRISDLNTPVSFYNSSPNSPHDYKIYLYTMVSGKYCVLDGSKFEFGKLDVGAVCREKTASSLTIAGNLNVTEPIYYGASQPLGDNIITAQYWENHEEEGEEFTLTGLDPETTYNFKYHVETSDPQTIVKDFSFQTEPMTFATLPGEPMNTTTALLCAETNLSDEEVNVGFEWRRYEDPKTMPSKKVVCAVIDGKLMGALGNLKDDVYYSYRPYYTSDSGKTYYGEWITFLTGDVDVYFDPTVRTYDAKVLSEYSAVLKGYALRGSEKIARQGFQYWNAWGGAATRSAVSDVVEVEVSGQKMTHTLTELKPSTTYNYRTFVVTETGKVMYGEEHTFTTKDDPTSVDDVTEECAIKVVTGYYDLQGRRIQQPAHGINIVRYSDGTTRKFYVK